MRDLLFAFVFEYAEVLAVQAGHKTIERIGDRHGDQHQHAVYADIAARSIRRDGFASLGPGDNFNLGIIALCGLICSRTDLGKRGGQKKGSSDGTTTKTEP